MKRVTPKQLRTSLLRAEQAIQQGNYSKAITNMGIWTNRVKQYLMDMNWRIEANYWNCQPLYMKLKKRLLSLAKDERLADSDREQIFDLLLDSRRQALEHELNFMYIDLEYNRALIDLAIRQNRVAELKDYFTSNSQHEDGSIRSEHQTLLFLLLHRSGDREGAYAFQRTIGENFNFEEEVIPYLNDQHEYRQSFEIIARWVSYLLELNELPKRNELPLIHGVRIEWLSELLPLINDEQLTRRYQRLLTIA